MSESRHQISYPPRLLSDLSRSGLSPEDMRVKPLTGAEKAACGVSHSVDGYVIPYFKPDGSPQSFYRVRLYDQDVRYRQLADEPNHVYYPLGFAQLFAGAKFLMIVEGEKKATAAVKVGIPCVGLSGVDSWKSRTIQVDKSATLAQKSDGRISIRLPAGSAPHETHTDVLAVGLKTLIDLAVARNLPVLIAYDTERLPNGRFGTKLEVQRAAATLGFELRYRGIPVRNIRQLFLPEIADQDKTGLDDLLESDAGYTRLGEAIKRCLERRSAFPRHPNPREYVNKKLQKGSLPRSEQIGLASAILSDLDARGQRLRSPDSDQLYYFSNETKTLVRVSFTGKPDFSDSPFGRYLYQQYNLGLNDQKVLGWVATQFAAEDPIQEVHPEKVLTWRGDTLYYHINNGAICKVSAKGIELLDNGDDNVLFEAGMVNEIPSRDFEKGLETLEGKPLSNQWLQVLKGARISEGSSAQYKTDEFKALGGPQRGLLSLLYYISPLFYRWRGTQLPVEITTGEAGSGKSTLFMLRLSILTGVPELLNMPRDLRDWNAKLAGVGALHVTDNVAFTDSAMRQQLSDEICRLVTEPKPSIQQRKLYTDVGIIKIPVRCVFGITAIKQPFQNVDIIQRSIITELDKGVNSELTYDAEWETHQLDRFGGRTRWLVHQLLVVKAILQLVSKKWDLRYRARYRLINVEQLLLFGAEVLGMDGRWIPGYLESSRDSRAQDADWTLEGLQAFVDFTRKRHPDTWPRYRFPLAQISEWAESEAEFAKCTILVSSRQLARYLQQHKHTVATSTGLIPIDGPAHPQQFRIQELKRPG